MLTYKFTGGYVATQDPCYFLWHVHIKVPIPLLISFHGGVMKEPNTICWYWPFLSYNNDSSLSIMLWDMRLFPAGYYGHYNIPSFSPSGCI